MSPPVSTAEAVRDQQEANPAATGGPGPPPAYADQAASAPAVPAEGVPAARSFGQVSSDLFGARQDWLGASRQLQQRLQEGQGRMAPVLADAEQAVTNRELPSPPPVPQIGPPPSLGLTPFLAPVAGEAPETSIAKLIQLVGLFGASVSGAVRGDARAGLASLTGALQGWQAGDKERADRAFADYQAKTDAAIKAWQIERTGYQDMMARADMDLESKFKLVQLTALANQNDQVAAAAEARDLEKLVGMLGEESKVAAELEKEMMKLAASKLGADRADALKGMTAEVRTELEGTEGAREYINAGVTPPAHMIREANARVKQELAARQIEVAERTGLAAAARPERTPPAALEALEALDFARGQLSEMKRLIPLIPLEETVGGARPWINKIMQEGKVAGIPIPIKAGMSADQVRFLTLLQDYSDAIVRSRTGSAMPAGEYQNLLKWIPDQQITGPALIARLNLNDDTVRARAASRRAYLAGGGYRSPEPGVPSLAPSPAPTGGGWSIRPKAEPKK